MKELSVKELEDYFTSKLAGITVVNRKIEFPEAKLALNIEGEKNYFLIEDAKDNLFLQDGDGNVRLSMENEKLDTFLQHVLQLILDEEAEFNL